MMCLQIHPEFGAIAEIKGQPQCRIGGDPAAIVDDLGNPVRRDPDRLGKLALREAIFGQELHLQHFTRGNRREFVFFHANTRQW